MTRLASIDPGTLPEWLRARRESNDGGLALRHKRRGLWHSESWSELAASVEVLAAALHDRGFSRGDQLLVDAPPVPSTFRSCLAAWWLGGAVVVLEPGASPVLAAGARFALAGGEEARSRLTAAAPAVGQFALGIQLEGDTELVAEGGWLSFGELTARPPAPIDACSAAGDIALVRHGTRDGESTPAASRSRREVTHAELLELARDLVGRGGIGVGAALAGRALSLGDQLEVVLAAWCVAGFTLGFVESDATEHVDRRELEPRLLFDAAEGYAALTARIDANLPPHASRERRWLERALGGGAPRLARRFVTSRLRAVVGFGSVRHAVVVGGVAPGLERLLGVPLLEWPPRRGTRAEDTPRSNEAPLTGLELAGTESDAA